MGKHTAQHCWGQGTARASEIGLRVHALGSLLCIQVHALILIELKAEKIFLYRYTGCSRL